MAKNIRTGLEDLTVDECWNMLGRTTVGRLAVSISNRPDIFPVNYRVDNETIVVRTAPGLKLAAATLGPEVAFEVDELDAMRHTGWSVVIKGPAEELNELGERLEAEALKVEPWSDAERDRYFRITPEHITGRRIPGS